MRNVSTIEKLSCRHPKSTKSITDIFRSPHKRILIEGAPGIGKTVLTKEIACCWAKDEILSNMTLFLLFIRDPNLHHVNSNKELVNYLNKDYLSDSEAEVAVDELRETKGKDIVFVIDGYDECPCDSKLKSFVDELVKKKRLPLCMVVITSRPTASLSLRQLVDQRIEILGLAKKEQKQYISESLKGSPEMKTKLQEYLKQQPIINSLIRVPLHLTILLYLLKQNKGSLPETLTEMNEYFIIHTIYRELARLEQCSGLKAKTISDLPPDVFDTICRLSKLAFEGLKEKQLVFTLDEVAEEVCPKVDVTSVAINGYGLLQAVRHYCQEGAAGKTTSLNFLHLTMQEYLAALHVTKLPNDQQLSLMKDTFWDEKFKFMWIMYVGIVGTKSISLISSLYQPDISHSHKKHNVFARKCLFLFQCYLELKQDCLIPKVVSSLFSDGNIILSGQTLMPHHITSLTEFMKRSTTQCISLNLNGCNIGCDGMSILANYFTNFQEKILTLKNVKLKHNNLFSLWGQLTEKHNDEITNSGLLQSVESLDLSYNKFCDSGATEMFTIWKNFQTSNEIVNVMLQDLNICGNMISDDGTVSISEYLRNNNTLKILNVSRNWISKEGVMRIVEACSINRTLHKLVCTHNNLSKSGLADINEYIREESAVQIFDASWNSIYRKTEYAGSYKLCIKTTYQLLDIQKQTLQSDNDGVVEDLWHFNEITELKYRMKFLQISFECFFNVDSIDLQSTLCNFEVEILTDCLKTNNRVIELNISNCQTNDSSELIFSSWLMTNRTLCKLNLSSNKITDEGAKRLAEAIQVNTVLQELNISKNWISKEGVMRIVEACTINRTLHKLVCTHNNLSKSGLAVINEYIREENAVQIFDASWNSIGKRKLFRDSNYRLCIKTTYQLLDIQKQTLQSDNDDIVEDLWYAHEITELKYEMEFLQISFECFFNVDSIDLQSTILFNYEVEILTDCLKTNDRVSKLNISSSFTQGSSVLTFTSYLMASRTLCKLNLSSNEITDEGAKRLAEAIQVNTTLQELNISKNWISKEGVMRIVEACTKNRTLHKLVCTHNNLSKYGLAAINEYIRKENAVQIFDASWNIIGRRLSIISTLDVQQSNTIQEKSSLIDHLTEEVRVDFLKCCFYDYDIQHLNLMHEKLDRDNFSILSKCLMNISTLKELNLPDNRLISKKGIGVIADAIKVNNTLQKLNINCSAILYSKALQFSSFLRKNSSLIELDISRNDINCEGATAIAESLQVNTILQKLNISHNKISNDGAIAFSDCLKTNKTLKELDISYNMIKREGAIAIAEALRKNTTLQRLYISCCETSDDAVIAFCECLKNSKSLMEFGISRSMVTYVGTIAIVKALRTNTTLQKLCCEMSNDGVNVFSEYLKTNTTLIELDLSVTNIETSAHKIAEALKVNNALQKLNISQSQRYYDRAMSFFNTYHENNTVVMKGVSVIAESLTKSYTLVKLNISNCKVSDDEAVVFSGYLKANSALIELDMSQNDIMCKGTIAIANALKVNNVIQTLDISRNKISSRSLEIFMMHNENVTCEGTYAIAEALKVNTTLQELNISHNDIHDDGAIAFSECLKTNTTLIELDISWNEVTCKGARAVAEVLKMNNTLQKLNISLNRIWHDGIYAFSECLKTNTTLIFLDFPTWPFARLNQYTIIAIESAIKANQFIARERIMSKLKC